jgi:hypothetical protein
MALSIAPVNDPFEPVIVRGRVAECSRATRRMADLAPGVHDPDGRQARELGRLLGGLAVALCLAASHLALPLTRWTSFADYGRALDIATAATIAELADMSLGVARTSSGPGGCRWRRAALAEDVRIRALRRSRHSAERFPEP